MRKRKTALNNMAAENRKNTLKKKRKLQTNPVGTNPIRELEELCLLFSSSFSLFLFSHSLGDDIEKADWILPGHSSPNHLAGLKKRLTGGPLYTGYIQNLRLILAQLGNRPCRPQVSYISSEDQRQRRDV